MHEPATNRRAPASSGHDAVPTRANPGDPVSQDRRPARESTPDRKQIAITLVAAAVVIAVGVVAIANAIWAMASRTTGGSPSDSPSGASGWSPLSDPPLSARQSATAVAVGSSVVIVGGDDSPPCPPNADCAMPARSLSDGARYDASSGGWASIAPSPVPIPMAETAVVGDTAFFWVPTFGPNGPSFLSYDVGDDVWEELPLPPAVPQASVRLVATSDAVIAYPPSQELGDRLDQVYDISSGGWRDLPPDPLTPSFDRTIVAIDGRLVSVGVELGPNPGVRPPVYRTAVLNLTTGEWRRLPDAPVVGGGSTWFVAGGLVVNPSLGGADGGQVNNWGRMFPYGGMLDVDGAAWLALPNPPPEGPSYPAGPVGGGDTAINGHGWALDVGRLAWERVGGPVGGPEFGAAAAWAEDRLVLFGGTRFVGNVGELLADAWEWRPAGS